MLSTRLMIAFLLLNVSLTGYLLRQNNELRITVARTLGVASDSVDILGSFKEDRNAFGALQVGPLVGQKESRNVANSLEKMDKTLEEIDKTLEEVDRTVGDISFRASVHGCRE